MSAIEIIRTDSIAMVQLNRPERRNALTEDMLLEFHSVLEHVAQDEGVRVVVLCGAGQGFCAGQDLSERDPRGRSDPFDLQAAQVRLYHPIITQLKSMPKPVICAAQGITAGAGAGIALACDMLMVSGSTQFYFAFVKIGLSVDAGLGWHLVRTLGAARAKALLMTGSSLTSAQLVETGLAHSCHEEDRLEQEAMKLAQTLAKGPATALAAIKSAVDHAASGMDLRTYLSAEAALQGQCGTHSDYAEGVLAFLEKRAPKFGS